MRTSILFIIVVASFSVLLISYTTVYAQDQVEYTIQIYDDGSAAWTIYQATDINVTLDYIEFLNKVTSLVEGAKNRTGRNMAVKEDTISMMSTFPGSYVVIEYGFYWINFSVIENKTIIIGDVFQVENFFLQLYGDGELYITYPPQYIVETVSPSPNKQDASLNMLKWFRTKDFINGQPIIKLRNEELTSDFLEILAQNGVIIVGFVVIAAGSSLAFYLFRLRKKKEKGVVKLPEPISLPGIENAEEKILKTLKSSGGSLYQSAIVDQCRFSKAKTSQLLAALEGRGIISRYKKGRDKLVVLVEQNKK